MSGICGIFTLDHAPVTDTDLRAMTAMLERRGPEGIGRWQVGPVGLGHTLLATTPELLFERQPFTHSETSCVITADVRLDNRDELLRTFGLSDRCDSTGDAQLLLLTYLTWGEQCPDRLLGDFAFAIWDPRHQKVFCARDHSGLRPLYYHYSPGKHFMFASDARAILVLPKVPYLINEGRVADFLVPELEWIDYTSTFFEGVYRLPPGHKATVTNSTLSVVEYWKLEPGPEFGSMSDDDYRQGFLDVFTKSVEARLRTPEGRVGSMLSGGMDSGSVVAVAKEIFSGQGLGSFPTFSAARRLDTDDSECEESRAIYAATSMQSIEPNLIHPDALAENFNQLVSGLEEPFDGEFMILKAIYLAAHEQGIRVILDGGGGDIVLHEGSHIVRLMRRGKFSLAFAEFSAENRLWGDPTIFIFLRYARAAFVPEFVKKCLRGLQHRISISEYLKNSLISQKFAEDVNIHDRFSKMRQIFPQGQTTDYAVECCNMIRPNVTGGRERYARIAAALGMEASDPFLDRRVLEYCSRLPGQTRLKNGWPKVILRQLMADKLPDEVVWRRRKPHLGWLFNEKVTKQALHDGELELTRLESALTDYVESAALDRTWQAFRDGGDGEQLHSAWLLSLWLREAAQRPVVLDY